MKITVYTIKGDNKINSDDSVVIGENIFSEITTCMDMNTFNVISVCDGVGGNPGGKKASSFVSNSISTMSYDGMTEAKLKEFFLKINEELIDYAKAFPYEQNMATTCTALINSDLGLYLVHIGNCRLYKLQGRYLKQLSSDQTVHQLLKSSFALEDDDITNKNEIYACMGGGDERYSNSLIVKKVGENYKGQNFIITSDGIHDYLSDEEMEKILFETDNDECAVRKMASIAKYNGSTDDSSVVIIRS